jgi:Nif-specific regulatory protein
METAAQWMTWGELPWIVRGDSGGVALAVAEQLLRAAVDHPSPERFLHEELPTVATEFSVQWVAELDRSASGDWTERERCGRNAPEELPTELFNAAVERGAGGFIDLERPAGWSLIAVPLSAEATPAEVLALAGRNLQEGDLPTAVIVGRLLGHCLRVVKVHDRQAAQSEQLRQTFRVASSFADERDPDRLLSSIAVEATMLLGCDRASIFLRDRDTAELVARPALGMAGRELRIAESAGIVGEALRMGKAVRVDDAYADRRFNAQVDRESGYRTRNLLCVPMRDRRGQIVGVFEAINKEDGPFTADDEETLAWLGGPAAAALGGSREWQRLRRSRSELAEQAGREAKLIGSSAAVTALRSTVENLAASDLPVLIVGERGTGKEVVARSLHFQGPRADGPIVPVRCASVPPGRLEVELFGQEAGTTSDDPQPGKVEAAHGGTLYLDEVGELGTAAQGRLLALLESKAVTRVEGARPVSVDVRIVAATNADLARAVQERRFRADLFYRLGVVTQILPPLRDRPEDVLVLAEHFLQEYCRQARRPPLSLSPAARRRLQEHNWPGNTRELQNLMERVAFLCTAERVEPDHLPLGGPSSSGKPAAPSTVDIALKDATQRFQQEYIRAAIRQAAGNMSQAAESLGLHRSNLYRKMRQLGMEEAAGE